MTRLTFYSGLLDCGPIHKGPLVFDADVIKNEPMFFSADARYAFAHGGPITSVFLDAVLRKCGARPEDVIIDTRSHMLMPGWYPCIPGWHLDDVPRTRLDGQPDHANPAYRARHYMAIFGDASRTEFAQGKIELEDVPEGSGKIVYGEWHRDIEALVENGAVQVEAVREGHLIAFDWQDFHRGAPATKDGWRWFGRATVGSKRKVTNEIRKQVQVYMPAPNAGW